MRVGGTWEDWFRGQGSYAEDIGMASFSLLLFLLGTFLFLFFLLFVNYDDGTRHEFYWCSGGAVFSLVLLGPEDINLCKWAM